MDLMKIEDPLSPPGDQPDLNKLRRTKQPLCVLGRKPVCPVRFCSQVCSSWGGGGGGRRPQASLLGEDTAPVPPGPSRVTPHVRLPYWCCRLAEYELEPELECSELPLGACRAWGSGC